MRRNDYADDTFNADAQDVELSAATAQNRDLYVVTLDLNDHSAGLACSVTLKAGTVVIDKITIDSNVRHICRPTRATLPAGAALNYDRNVTGSPVADSIYLKVDLDL